MVEIGQIEKPEADMFAGKRKLYCIANVYPIEDTPDDFKELFHRYWDEVAQQIKKIEIAGKIQKIFCEILFEQGEEALNMLEKLNERIVKIIREKTAEGGILIPLESKDILGSYTDWGNCLRVVYTKEVFTKILEFYTEISNKRLQQVLDIIDKNLSEAEAGLLLMKDEDRAKLQFPKDMEIFLITPPSYDDIMRWFRDELTKGTKE
jgi:hypothetical protein